MISTPMLSMLNFKDTFLIERDALGDGIGAVLQQQGKPIAFMRRAPGCLKNLRQHMQKRCLQLWKQYILVSHTY